MDIVTIRRQRLQQIIDEMFGGSQAKFIEKTEINQGELSGLLKQKSFGEKKARKIEQQIGLAAGYLDTLGEPLELDQGAKQLLDVYNRLPQPLQHIIIQQINAMYETTVTNETIIKISANGKIEQSPAIVKRIGYAAKAKIKTE